MSASPFDPQVVEAMVRRHRRALGIPEHMDGFPSPEDQAQEVLTRVLQRFGADLEELERPFSYLKTAARYLIYNDLQALKNAGSAVDDMEDVAWASGPEPPAEMKKQMVDALQGISDGAKYLAQLYTFLECPLTCKRMAFQAPLLFGITDVAFRKRLCRIRAAQMKMPENWAVRPPKPARAAFTPEQWKRLEHNTKTFGLQAFIGKGQEMNSLELLSSLQSMDQTMGFAMAASLHSDEFEARGMFAAHFELWAAVGAICLSNEEPLSEKLTEKDYGRIGYLQLGTLSADYAMHLFAALGDEERMIMARDFLSTLRDLANGHAIYRLKR